MIRTFVCLAYLAAALPASPQHPERSAHADKKTRQIAALSEQDIASIRAGSGWGLALPAELNGAPGPRHVLDLAAPLELTDEQTSSVNAIFTKMKEAAVDTGAQYIAAEKALNDAFVAGAPDPIALKRLVDDAGRLRAHLRFVHLSAHLETLAVLTSHQVERYEKLRGYAADPCLTVPEGHDADMWKKHHGCR